MPAIPKPIRCYIRENSWLARMASRRLKARRLAMVVGSTIYLHGIDALAFMQQTAWVRHEVCHIRQYRKHTFIGFLFLYLLETIRQGYIHNRFEKEAREAECDGGILTGVTFHVRSR